MYLTYFAYTFCDNQDAKVKLFSKNNILITREFAEAVIICVW